MGRDQNKELIHSLLDATIIILSFLALAYAAIGLRLPVHPDEGITTVDYTEIEYLWRGLFLPLAIISIGLCAYAIYSLLRSRSQRTTAPQWLSYCLAILPTVTLAFWPFRVALGLAQEISM
jgi:hypothetical protein